VFRLLGYIGQNKTYSSTSVKTLMTIKYCAIALAILIVMAGVYIALFHSKKDDPAGFLAICMVTTFASIVVAALAARFEKRLHNDMDMKEGNGLAV
jgi:hypothetical protein